MRTRRTLTSDRRSVRSAPVRRDAEYAYRAEVRDSAGPRPAPRLDFTRVKASSADTVSVLYATPSLAVARYVPAHGL